MQNNMAIENDRI